MREVEPAHIDLVAVHVADDFKPVTVATIIHGLEGDAKYALNIPSGSYKFQYISESSSTIFESKEFSVLVWGIFNKFPSFIHIFSRPEKFSNYRTS